MKTPSKPNLRAGRALTGALAAVLFLGAALLLRSEETKAEPSAKAPAGQSSTPVATNAPAAKIEKAARKKLSGAELYAMHCNRCHPERYPAERTAAQWKTILLHMRVRANIPAAQARTILTFLQENSGN